MLFAKQVIALYFFSPTFRKTKSFYLFKYGKERMGFVSGIKGVKAQVVLRTTARARVPVPEPEPVRAAHSRIVRFSAHFALRVKLECDCWASLADDCWASAN